MQCVHACVLFVSSAYTNKAFEQEITQKRIPQIRFSMLQALGVCFMVRLWFVFRFELPAVDSIGTGIFGNGLVDSKSKLR